MNMETMIPNTITLKVGGNTNPGSLKTAICGHLKNGKAIVNLVCIGVAANYIATKALIMARGQVMTCGRTLKYECYFADVVIDADASISEERHKTAIRWEVSIL